MALTGAASLPPALLALIAAMLFGVSQHITRLGLPHGNARLGSMLSIASTAGMYWLLAPWLLHPSLWEGAWRWQFLAMFAMVGLISPGISLFLAFEGNRRMGPTLSGTLAATAPLFATVAAMVVLAERPGAWQGLGTLTIVLGVMLLSWRGRAGAAASWPTWVLLLPLGAAATRGIAQMSTRFALGIEPAPFNGVLITFTVSLLLHLALTPMLGGMRMGADRTLPGRGMAWFLLTGVLNGVAMLCVYSALHAGTVIVVSPLVSSFPLFTMLFSLVFGIESLGWRVIVGVLLVVGGVAGVSGG